MTLLNRVALGRVIEIDHRQASVILSKVEKQILFMKSKFFIIYSY